MEQEVSTTRARAAAAAAGAVMTFSAGIVTYGIIDSNLPAATGGGLIALAAAGMMGLSKARTWAVDTSTERRALAEAKQRAEDEHTKYIALGAAQAEEHRRRLRDLEGDRAAGRAEVAALKRALDDRYEAGREQLIVESMETGVRLYLAGLLKAPTATTAPAQVLPLFPPQPTRAGAAEQVQEERQPARRR
ncbi:hypothetical protein LG634_24930 [Streptomyces bambusae]|uniref:hypothetical protein n=1 Tax=Streptomyces bambusae TaxID=1550616 RepID=UPI001CFC9A40|nr:hypothetical protein [Streptomyces bambusae]MCB5168059.1 hypothetical protein [Streptomyces bambusae]